MGREGEGFVVAVDDWEREEMKKNTNALPAPIEKNLAQVIPIRTETVLSQYPIHRLSKGKEPLEIQVTRTSERGKVTTVWKVSPNAEYGEPGILAYKLDTILINRLIYEAGPNVPEVIRLGSLNDIGKELGRSGTRNTAQLVGALSQNAGALITAKLDYTGKDGTRRTFEFRSTRYGVVFTGESLPDKKKADAVYIVLHPLFREVLRFAKTRPLDYEYLKSLPPAAQRFYELISFQIYAALKNGNPRAKYLYSDFCKYAPLTRFDDWNKVRPQMHRIHKPHIESGYLAKIEFEEITNADGLLDWVMWYTPGRKARHEFKESGPKKDRSINMPTGPRLVEAIEQGREESALTQVPENTAIAQKLMSFGIDGNRAARLVEQDRTECELWANAWPYQNQKGMENPAAVLIRFIETKRRPLPKGYEEQLEHERRRKENVEREEQRVAEDLHFQFFAPLYRARLKEELAAIERTRPDVFRAFMEHFEKHYAKGLKMVTSEEMREKVILQRAIEFFNEMRSELGAEIITFEEWNESENKENANPVEWLNRDRLGIYAELQRQFTEGHQDI